MFFKFSWRQPVIVKNAAKFYFDSKTKFRTRSFNYTTSSDLATLVWDGDDSNDCFKNNNSSNNNSNSYSNIYNNKKQWQLNRHQQRQQRQQRQQQQQQQHLQQQKTVTAKPTPATTSTATTATSTATTIAATTMRTISAVKKLNV